MKRYTIALILLLIIGALFAQDINSFRNLGSAGALDGELEYAFNPADLNYLSGIHLFSGLSNLYAKDKLFDNSGENYLLLGASTDRAFIRNLKAALLFKYVDSETPMPISYYNGTAFGNLEYRVDQYYDSNNNGLYDRYNSLYQKYRNVETENGSDLFLVLSKAFSPSFLMGYKLGLIQTQESGSAATYSGDYITEGDASGESIAIIENQPEMDPSVPPYKRETKENAQYSNEFTQSKIQNQIVLNKTGDKWNLAAYYTLNLLQDERLIDDKLNLSRKDDSVPQYDDTEEYFNQNKSNGIDNKLYARVKREFIQNVDFQKTGFLALGIGVKHSLLKIDAKEKTFEKEIDYITAVERIQETNTYEYNYTADSNGLGFNADIKLNYPLNNSTIIGLGAFFEADKSTQKGDYSTTIDYKEYYYHTEDDWNSAALGTFKELGDIQIEQSSSKFTVPVGLEYWFTKNMKWALRCGSRFTRTMSIEKTNYAPTLIEPARMEQIDTDGSHYVSYAASESVMENTSRRDIVNETELSYGLCFKANKNLKIELINMFENTSSDIWNASFIKNLKLSFSLVF